MAQNSCCWCRTKAPVSGFNFVFTDEDNDTVYLFCSAECRHCWIQVEKKHRNIITRWKVRLEFRPQDLWIGAFWKRNHLWICLIPMFPIHIHWRKIFVFSNGKGTGSDTSEGGAPKGELMEPRP